MPTGLGCNQEIDRIARKTKTLEIVSMVFPALLKKEVEKAMALLIIIIK